MDWKKRFSFTAKFTFETEVKSLNQVEDLAKNYCDEAFKSCKELEADLMSVDFQDNIEILDSISQTVGDPAFKTQPAKESEMYIGYGIEYKSLDEFPFRVCVYSMHSDKEERTNGDILGKFALIQNAELFLEALERR